MAWRMKEKCDDCPFHTSGPGLRLRKTLRPGRWEQILNLLSRDGHFQCHKTTGGAAKDELLCAGSLEWQEENVGYPGQLARIMERVDGLNLR